MRVVASIGLREQPVPRGIPRRRAINSSRRFARRRFLDREKYRFGRPRERARAVRLIAAQFHAIAKREGVKSIVRARSFREIRPPSREIASRERANQFSSSPPDYQWFPGMRVKLPRVFSSSSFLGRRKRLARSDLAPYRVKSGRIVRAKEAPTRRSARRVATLPSASPAVTFHRRAR